MKVSNQKPSIESKYIYYIICVCVFLRKKGFHYGKPERSKRRRKKIRNESIDSQIKNMNKINENYPGVEGTIKSTKNK